MEGTGCVDPRTCFRIPLMMSAATTLLLSLMIVFSSDFGRKIITSVDFRIAGFVDTVPVATLPFFRL